MGINKENIFKKLFKNTLNFIFDFHDYKFCSNRKYMLTPCLHVYHSLCMEKWMKHKNECPTDRLPLSPVEFLY
jgi:hypothetical protein